MARSTELNFPVCFVQNVMVSDEMQCFPVKDELWEREWTDEQKHSVAADDIAVENCGKKIEQQNLNKNKLNKQ